MPLYEYKCNGCKENFEVIQRITEKPIEECPKCKSKDIKKIISKNTSFFFKHQVFMDGKAVG